MVKITKEHMLDKPYIKDVINELQIKGFDEQNAKIILVKYYKPLKRVVGLNPNACDFANALISIEQTVKRVYNPDDPNQVYIGHLKKQL